MFGAGKFEDAIKELEAKEKELKTREENLVKKEFEFDLREKNFETQKGQVFKTMELEMKGKLLDETSKIRSEYDAKLSTGLEENYNKLSKSLTSLHEEGNANTKYLEKITLKMMDTMKPSVAPSHQLEYEEDE